LAYPWEQSKREKMVSTRSQTRQAPVQPTLNVVDPAAHQNTATDGVIIPLVPPSQQHPAVREAIAHLNAEVEEHLPTANRELIARGVEFAIDAHSEVCRKSGEPYVVHPIEVAAILARMRLDSETIVGALLHDVVEDTDYTSEQIQKQFGERISRLVDGVTKLGRIPWTADEDPGKPERDAQARVCARCFWRWSTTSASF